MKAGEMKLKEKLLEVLALGVWDWRRSSSSDLRPSNILESSIALSVPLALASSNADGCLPSFALRRVRSEGELKLVSSSKQIFPTAFRVPNNFLLFPDLDLLHNSVREGSKRGVPGRFGVPGNEKEMNGLGRRRSQVSCCKEEEEEKEKENLSEEEWELEGRKGREEEGGRKVNRVASGRVIIEGVEEAWREKKRDEKRRKLERWEK